MSARYSTLVLLVVSSVREVRVPRSGSLSLRAVANPVNTEGLPPEFPRVRVRVAVLDE